MTDIKTMDNMGDITGKRVLIRVDYNVPMENGEITDMTRIDATIKTIEEVIAKGGKPVLMSHMGRPKGKKDPKLSLEPIAKALSERMNKKVTLVSDYFVNESITEASRKTTKEMQQGEIVLLENLRYHDEEEANDEAFASSLASLGDIYINDAFATAHRAHASTYTLATMMPAYAGRLMEEETKALSIVLEKPEKPVMGIVAGFKVDSKTDLLNNLVEKLDVLVLGGAMANTFLAATGIDMGASFVEKEMFETARTIMAKAKTCGCRIILPVDVNLGVADINVMKESNEEVRSLGIVSIKDIPANASAYDIGPASIANIQEELKNVKTVIYNGPTGAFEFPPFDKSTNAIAETLANHVTKGDLICVAGGGDTVAALEKFGLKEKMTYVSTAGGAFLEWMEGKELPGVEALRHKEKSYFTNPMKNVTAFIKSSTIGHLITRD